MVIVMFNFIFRNVLILLMMISVVFFSANANSSEEVNLNELCNKDTLALYLAWRRANILSHEDFKNVLGFDKHKAAAVSQDWDSIRIELEKYGIDSIEAAEMLVSAASAGYTETVTKMIEFGVKPKGHNDNMPLLAAAQCGRVETVQELIFWGADPNASIPGLGDAMMSAIFNNDEALAETLLNAGYSKHLERSTNARLQNMLIKSDLKVDVYPWSELVQ